MNCSRRSGTSLIEVLVVIVVFLVGILAVVQVFPGGFKILSASAKNTTASALARAMQEGLKSRADQLPDAIVPVIYTFTGGVVAIDKDPNRFPNDLGPAYSDLDAGGVFHDSGGNPIGNWQYMTGSALTRRVLGEGKIIPTPRLVGAQYGSLLSLQFAPLVYNPTYQSLFVVYGNDMTRRSGDPSNFPIRRQSYEFYVDEEDSPSATLYLPMNPGKPLTYRAEMSAYVNGNSRRDLVDMIISVPAGSGWSAVAIASRPEMGSDSLDGVEFDSVRVARAFDQIPLANSFSSDPYEYKLLSAQMGLVLFNPVGFNYVIRRPNGRRDPLIGRVSYDVFDWRIIHDEFRVPDTLPAQYRLAVGSLKVSSELGVDGLQNQGIGVQAPDSTGTPQIADLVLQDVDTGSLFVFQEGTTDPSRTSYLVNKSIGLVTLLDADNNPSNGIQMWMVYPGTTTPVLITVTNRSLRALYMGKGDWAVQVLKPAARYIETWTRPGIGEFYIGQSSNFGGLANRIYFPPADAGRVVSLGELYYTNTAGNPVGPVQLTAKVQANNMDMGLPYIQVSDYYPDFSAFDYSYVSAVKSVKGASVAVRVLWNPDTFTLSGNAASNMDHLEKWMQGWRRSTVETYLQRGY